MIVFWKLSQYEILTIKCYFLKKSKTKIYPKNYWIAIIGDREKNPVISTSAEIK